MNESYYVVLSFTAFSGYMNYHTVITNEKIIYITEYSYKYAAQWLPQNIARRQPYNSTLRYPSGGGGVGGVGGGGVGGVGGGGVGGGVCVCVGGGGGGGGGGCYREMWAIQGNVFGVWKHYIEQQYQVGFQAYQKLSRVSKPIYTSVVLAFNAAIVVTILNHCIPLSTRLKYTTCQRKRPRYSRASIREGNGFSTLYIEIYERSICYWWNGSTVQTPQWNQTSIPISKYVSCQPVFPFIYIYFNSVFGKWSK